MIVIEGRALALEFAQMYSHLEQKSPCYREVEL